MPRRQSICRHHDRSQRLPGQSVDNRGHHVEIGGIIAVELALATVRIQGCQVELARSPRRELAQPPRVHTVPLKLLPYQAATEVGACRRGARHSVSRAFGPRSRCWPGYHRQRPRTRAVRDRDTRRRHVQVEVHTADGQDLRLRHHRGRVRDLAAVFDRHGSGLVDGRCAQPALGRLVLQVVLPGRLYGGHLGDLGCRHIPPATGAVSGYTLVPVGLDHDGCGGCCRTSLR